MHILLALVFAAAVGAGLHYLLPARDLRGVLLAPAVAVGSAAAIYAGLTWVWGEASWLTWLSALVAPIAIAIAWLLVSTAVRRRSDAAFLAAA
ncbi:hypothetical protein [Microbacterium indicum]|uniref:hypothetical protein n=1 Tax=Microbacterium indicum TaxID=358100 RepID=UPI000405107F|nr:hypothetical protein [Microbacterium indicum]